MKSSTRLVPVLLLVLSGCTTLPKSAPLLSQEVGRMIASSRESHEAMLDRYKLERQERADDFVRYVLTPRFIRNLLDPKQGGVDFDKEVCRLQGMDRAMEVQELIESVNGQVQAKRGELARAIEDMDQKLRTAVRQHYDALERANRSLTENLGSAAAVDAVRDELLRQLNVPAEVISPVDAAGKKLDELLK